MYRLLKASLGAVVTWVARPRVTGEIPTSGPVIVAANHLTEIDSLVLAVAISRRLTFVAKSDYFSGRGKGVLYRRLCRLTGQIPVARQGAGAGDPALEAARGILDAGGVWAIYPEGTRSPDGRLFRGRTGVARVALSRPDARVVPVAIIGTRDIDAPGVRGWRRGRAEVVIGDVFDISPWGGGAADPGAWRELTDALMLRIADLSGQEVVDRHPTEAEIAERDRAEGVRGPS